MSARILGVVPPRLRICRFCHLSQFVGIENTGSHSGNVKIAQKPLSLAPNRDSPWSDAMWRVSYRVNGSLLRPWGNSFAFGSLDADLAVGGERDPPHPFL